MNLVNKNGIIYIKNNGLKDATIFTRVLGAYNKGKLNVIGKKMARTWSLLAEKATFGMSSISLFHNPKDMVD